MGVLKYYSGVVCGPIIAAQSSNDVAWRPPANPRMLKEGKRERGQGHVTP